MYIEISGNTLTDAGGGISASTMSPYDLIVHDNMLLRCGAGITTSGANQNQVEHNRLVGCGAGVRVVTDYTPNLIVGCVDVWNNDAGDWIGTPDPSGSSGNFSADPLFCDPDQDLTLAAASPCLPGQHPYGWDCGTIGAFGQGCLVPVGASGESA